MVKAVLHDGSNDKFLKTLTDIEGDRVLITDTIRNLKSIWKTANNIGIDTIDVVDPVSNESFILTDLIITSGRKTVNSTVTVQITDGTNTEVIIVLDNSEVLRFSHSFSGGPRSWKNAKLQIITDAAGQTVNTFCSYVNIGEEYTLSYKEWKEQRERT